MQLRAGRQQHTQLLQQWQGHPRQRPWRLSRFKGQQKQPSLQAAAPAGMEAT